MVYAGLADNKVYALNAATGRELWRFDAGDAMEASPTVADGRLYVSTLDQVLYSLNSHTHRQGDLASEDAHVDRFAARGCGRPRLHPFG